MKNKKRAFTIVELVIVIAVIAILAAVLVPTFSGIVKKAQVSNDIQTATNLSKYVAIYKAERGIETITDESDLKNAICIEKGESYWNNLKPESANQGYHFWFSRTLQRVVVAKEDGEPLGFESVDKNASQFLINTKAFFGISDNKVYAEESYTEKHGDLKLYENPFRNGFKANDSNKEYYLMDKKGSDLAEIATLSETLKDENDYEKFAEKIIKFDNADLVNKLKTIVIVNEQGSFSYKNIEDKANELDTVPQIYFVNEVEKIGNEIIKFIDNNKTIIVEKNKDDVILDNTEEGKEEIVIKFPSTVTEIDDGSLKFAIDDDAEIVNKTNVVYDLTEVYSSIKESKNDIEEILDVIEDVLEEVAKNSKIEGEGVPNKEYNYTLNFDDNYSHESDPSNYVYGKGVLLPSNFNGEEYADIVKTGYKFTGLWIDEDENEVSSVLPTTHGDKVYTAKWEEIGYTVTINRADGTKYIVEQEFTVNNLQTVESFILGKIKLTENDAQYTYSWATGTEIPTTLELKNYEFTEERVVNKYDITWVVDGNETVNQVEYGTVPTFEGSTDKTANAQYTYTFTGWDVTPVAVTGNATYTAQYSSTVNKYTISWDTDGDGTVDGSEQVEYGTTPSHADGSKAETSKVIYNFKAWSPTIVAVTGDATYTATFDETTKLSVAFCFPNTDTFLYRVGNANAISVNNLFKVVDGDGNKVDDEEIDKVTITTVVGASGSFANGNVTFSGTGVVKVVAESKEKVSDDLFLEVVKGTNVTSLEGSVSNTNIVVIKDITFSTYIITNGTIFGNGFTLYTPNDYSASNMHTNNGYITLNNATLDNAKVVAPVYENAYIFQSQVTKDQYSNYPQCRCAVAMAVGDNTIRNSYISGGRCAVHILSNNVIIENSTIVGGSTANIDIWEATSVTLTDVVTVQNVTKCTTDTSKSICGLGILLENNTQLIINGTLRQYNWASKTMVNTYLSGSAKTLALKAFDYSDFYITEGSEKWANTGILYLCNWDVTDKVTNGSPNLFDNRSDKENYQGKDVSISLIGTTYSGGIYTYTKNGQTTYKTGGGNKDYTYSITGNGMVAPVFTYSNTKNNVSKTSDTEPYCTYSGNTIYLGTDNGTETLDFSDAIVTKDGEVLNTTITVNSDKATVSGNNITFSNKVTDYVVTFTATVNNKGYNPNGTVKVGTTTYSWKINVHIARLTFDPPTWDNVSATGSNHLWLVKNPDTTDPDYNEAIPVYNGIKVKYYNTNGEQQSVDLSGITTLPTINGDNATLTLNDGSKLTLNTAHSGYAYQLCNNVVYLYKTGSSRNNRDTTSKAIKYTFTDPNGLSTTSTITVTYSFSSSVPGKYIKLTDFQKGKYTTCSGEAGSSCFAAGTLITMADGTQKAIETLKGNEKILAWSFTEGRYVACDIFSITNHGEKKWIVTKLLFSDNTTLEIVGKHGIFDATLNKFVNVSELNVFDFIGHEFIKKEGDSFGKVELLSANIVEETTTSYSIISVDELDAIANDVLTLDPTIYFLLPFEIDAKTLKYDEVLMAKDIETIGLLTYEEFKSFAPHMTETQFYAGCGQNIKIALAKRIITMDEIIDYATLLLFDQESLID